MPGALNRIPQPLSATLSRLRWIPAILRLIQNTLLPNFCALCEDQCDNRLCTACIQSLPTLSTACSVCSLPLDAQSQQIQSKCGECLMNPPFFHQVICAFEYSGYVCDAVTSFKDGGDIYIGQALSGKLIETISSPDRAKKEIDRLPDILVPVPIYWKKRWVRHFNQSEVIAETLGRPLRIPVVRAISKTKATDSQKSLSRSDRIKSMSRGFKVNVHLLAGKHVCLIDDVITTGATANTLAKACLKAGAVRVDVWALARTPKRK